MRQNAKQYSATTVLRVLGAAYCLRDLRKVSGVLQDMLLFHVRGQAPLCKARLLRSVGGPLCRHALDHTSSYGKLMDSLAPPTTEVTCLCLKICFDTCICALPSFHQSACCQTT